MYLFVLIACLAIGLPAARASPTEVNDGKVDAFDVLTAYADGEELSSMKSITEKDKKLVEFWLDASEADQSTRCSLDYIRQLRKRIEEDKQKAERLGNLDELYGYAQYDIVTSCGENVTEQGLELGSVLTGKNDDLMEYVGFKFNKWLADRSDAATFRLLAEWMLWVVGEEKRANEKEFVAAWIDGPCKAVLEKLERPEVSEFKNFMDLIEETSFDPLMLEMNPAKYHIPVVQCCRHFKDESTGALATVWKSLQERDAQLERQVRLEALIDDADVLLDEDDDDDETVEY